MDLHDSVENGEGLGLQNLQIWGSFVIWMQKGGHVDMGANWHLVWLVLLFNEWGTEKQLKEISVENGI